MDSRVTTSCGAWACSQKGEQPIIAPWVFHQSEENPQQSWNITTNAAIITKWPANVASFFSYFSKLFTFFFLFSNVRRVNVEMCKNMQNLLCELCRFFFHSNFLFYVCDLILNFIWYIETKISNEEISNRLIMFQQQNLN